MCVLTVYLVLGKHVCSGITLTLIYNNLQHPYWQTYVLLSQEHIYHVLEQSKVPDVVELTPLVPSHDAPQLPPPFDPDNSPAPVYQDITELQTKIN